MGFLPGGSGPLSASSSRWFCQKHSETATPRTTIETMIRVRSSSRCSTSESPSSYLGARKRAIALRGAVSDDLAVHALRGTVRRRSELGLGLLVLAGDRRADL